MIIGIAGGSGSGKSTLAKALLHHFGEQQVTHIMQDHYYRRTDGKQDLELLNYDHPNALEFDLLAQHLNRLQQGNTIEMPLYDFAIHNRKNQARIIKPKKIILLEGILILSQPNIRSQLDISIFVTTPQEIRFQRRAARDIHKRGRTPESVAAQFNATVNPMHEKFVEPSKAHADLIVSGEEVIEITLEEVFKIIKHHYPFSENL